MDAGARQPRQVCLVQVEHDQMLLQGSGTGSSVHKDTAATFHASYYILQAKQLL